MIRLKNKFIFPVGIIISIIFLAISAILLYRNGYARDNGVYTPDFFSNGLWVVLFLSFFLLIFVIYSAQKFDKANTFQCFAIFGVMLYGLFVITGHIYYSQVEEKIVASNNISVITLEELNEAVLSENDNIIYVGRDNCQVCSEFYPKLENIALKYNLNILYYNTISDRDNEYVKMMEVLTKINITSVPSVVVKSKNSSLTFSGVSLEQQLIEYCEANYKLYY